MEGRDSGGAFRAWGMIQRRHGIWVVPVQGQGVKFTIQIVGYQIEFGFGGLSFRVSHLHKLRYYAFAHCCFMLVGYVDYPRSQTLTFVDLTVVVCLRWILLWDFSVVFLHYKCYKPQTLNPKP